VEIWGTVIAIPAGIGFSSSFDDQHLTKPA
jgi:hypothetical protein